MRHIMLALFTVCVCWSVSQARVVYTDQNPSLSEQNWGPSYEDDLPQINLEENDIANSRPTVIQLDDDHSLIVVADNEALKWLVLNRKAPATNDWMRVEYPSWAGPASSNAVSIAISDNVTMLFLQGSDGQAYGLNVVHADPKNPRFTEWIEALGYAGLLPFDHGVKLHGRDNIIVKIHEKVLKLFVRSMSNKSRLYMTSFPNGDKKEWTKWVLIGGDYAALQTDVSIAYNSFTTLLEAFMVSTDGYMYRSWQVKGAKWSWWDKTGYYAPKSTHRPVAHSMDTNMFNGRLNVFVHGDDGQIHHIWQTTCDGVANPWGWCTWSYWYGIGGEMPETADVANTLSAANNIHLGVEIFTKSKDGKLYKMWQTARHQTWQNWAIVEGMSDYHLQSLPMVQNDATGWLSAYAVNEDQKAIVVTQHKVMQLVEETVDSGAGVSVFWEIPVDEARHNDWIAVYPHGESDNHKYLDYYYVGGSQNPLSKPIPKGGLSFTTFLHAGKYDVRYLADRRFVDAIGTELTVKSGKPEENWVQIFEGVFQGLDLKNVSVKSCVDDAEHVEHDFMAAFEAFEERSVIKGIELLGKTLIELLASAKDCGIDAFLKERLEVFFNDLVSCVKDYTQCIHFVIDLGKEVLVLYENMYEIYGDIRAAHNAFNVNQFHQGGFNVGRVVHACLALPRL